MRAYVGLDIHSKSSSYAVQDGRGRDVGRGEVATSPEGLAEMKRKLRLEAGTPVGFESGTMAFYVARQVRALGLSPVVVDAHEVRLKAHRPKQKTDERDAREVCVGLRTGLYRSIVHVPSEAILLLRETLSRRRHFVRIQTGEINAAKRVLRSSGYRMLGRRSLTTAGAWKRVLKDAPEADGTRTFVELHSKAWQAAGQRVNDLEQNLQNQVAHLEPGYWSLRKKNRLGSAGSSYL